MPLTQEELDKIIADIRGQWKLLLEELGMTAQEAIMKDKGTQVILYNFNEMKKKVEAAGLSAPDLVEGISIKSGDELWP